MHKMLPLVTENYYTNIFYFMLILMHPFAQVNAVIFVAIKVDMYMICFFTIYYAICLYLLSLQSSHLNLPFVIFVAMIS